MAGFALDSLMQPPPGLGRGLGQQKHRASRSPALAEGPSMTPELLHRRGSCCIPLLSAHNVM